MGILSVFLAAVHGRLCGHKIVAPGGLNVAARLGHRIGRNPCRVRTHVGDEGHLSLVAQIDALIQLLRHHHGALGSEPQPARRFLLQLRGGQRRLRLAPALLAGDLLHHHIEAFERVFGALRGGRILGLELAIVVAHHPSGEARRAIGPLQLSCHRPILLGHKRQDELLALHDEPHGNRLHPARAQAAAHFVPEDGADLIAHDAV